MHKITTYIASTVLYTSTIVIISLTAIFFLFTYIAQVNDIGEGNYNSISAILYVACEAPANIYLIMPICGMLGSLMGLNLLSSNSELIAMRAAGQSVSQISKGVLVASLILASLTFLLGSYIAPYLQRKAIIQKTFATGGNEALVLYDTQSLWIKNDNIFTHVEKSDKGITLGNITKYYVKSNQLDTVSFGESASYENDGWKVENILTSQFNKNQILKKREKEEYWNNLLPPSVLNIIASKTDYLSFSEVLDYIRANPKESVESNKIWLKFWKFFFHPISLIILMLTAVPFSLSMRRSLAHDYKLLIAIIFGFSFYFINQTSGTMSLVYNFPVFIGASLPSAFFFVILLILIWKIKEC